MKTLAIFVSDLKSPVTIKRCALWPWPQYTCADGCGCSYSKKEVQTCQFCWNFSSSVSNKWATLFKEDYMLVLSYITLSYTWSSDKNFCMVICVYVYVCLYMCAHANVSVDKPKVCSESGNPWIPFDIVQLFENPWFLVTALESPWF